MGNLNGRALVVALLLGSFPFCYLAARYMTRDRGKCLESRTVHVPERRRLERLTMPGMPWTGSGVPIERIDPAHYLIVCDRFEKP